MSHLEREAYAYWTYSRHFRMKALAGEDTSEEADDLALIADFTENEVIRKGALSLIDLGDEAVTA